MKAITETFLRSQFKDKDPATFTLAPDHILTPSAAQWLNERRIRVVRATAVEIEPMQEAIPTPSQQTYVAADSDGGLYTTKPEQMTHLRGNLLVPKDHPRIAFRGLLDSLQAAILEQQHQAHLRDQPTLVDDLEDVLEQSRAILRAEVRDEPLDEKALLGLDDAALREQSHHPRNYFGCGHLQLSWKSGGTVLALNSLRCQAREAEIKAVKTFRGDLCVERVDLVQALNRMSSALYIMMLKEATGHYRGQK